MHGGGRFYWCGKCKEAANSASGKGDINEMPHLPIITGKTIHVGKREDQLGCLPSVSTCVIHTLNMFGVSIYGHVDFAIQGIHVPRLERSWCAW
jgi:hypothetical protein